MAGGSDRSGGEPSLVRDLPRPRRSLTALVVALALASPALAAVDLGREAPRVAGDCDRLVATHPDDLEAWRCYLYVARAFGEWNGAQQALTARLDESPETPGALLYLGRLRTDRYEPRGLDDILAAAAIYSRAGDAAGEVEARLAAAETYRRNDELDAADGQTALAEAAGGRDGTDRLRAKTLAGRARQSEKRGDIAAARARFEESRGLLRNDPDALLLAYVENGLGGLAWYEGRLEDAYRHYLRAAELYEATGDRPAEASERYNAALAAGRLRYRNGVTEAELRRRLAEAFDAAVSSGSPFAESSVRLLRAQDRLLTPAQRLAEAERAAELARQIGDMSKYTFALRLAAIHADDRQDSLLAESLGISTARGQFADVARTHAILGGVRYRKSDLGRAAEEFERGVEAVERLRDNQPDELAAARFLWEWAFLYYRSVGALLEANASDPRPELVDRAFRTLERLRGRAALQFLDDAGATGVMGKRASSDRRERDETLKEIVAIQKRLLAPGLSPEDADSLASQLRGLESRERAARVELARTDPKFAKLRYPAIVGIRDVQEALHPREALLTFQMSTREIDERKWYWNGGSWGLVVTRNDARAIPLPDSDVLSQRISAFLGVLERRDGLAAEAGAGLYDDLLREAIDALPGEVDRLIVVPAGEMHHLPLAVLGPAGAPPLGARFSLARVPSASWWVERRRDAPSPGPHASLSLADPPLPAVAAGAGGSRGAGWLLDLSLAPLPRARDEARTVASKIGDGMVWVGEEASEAALRRAALRRYGLLHFAAHAVVDDRRPESSALVLAPGGEDEDGLLQIREIVGLDTPGAIVFLSACRSASGEVTEADGVFGLARGFFQAGARAVVASLVPVRDDEAAAMAGEFAGRLAEGVPVAEALAQARRARMDAGDPAAAWGAFVVLGDPDAALETGNPGRVVAIAAGVGFFLLVLVIVLRRSLVTG